MGYLDSTGLSEVLTKIKNYSDGKDATLNTNISTVATNLASTDATVSALATRVGNLEGASLKYEIVTALPTTDIDTHTIYMIKDKESGEDKYNEYLYVNGAWELIGNTDIDLSGYQTKIDSNHKLSASLVSGLATIATSGKLSDASGDTTHRTVTDAEKTTWNNKANAAATLAGYGITNAYTKTEVDDLLDGFVGKETGKGLSTNDYTTTEKNKLSGIAAGAEVNVQADWNETTTTSDAYIKNKPTLGTASSKDVPSTGDASATQVVLGNDSRLSDSRPASDVSDWAKAASKPTYTKSEVGLGNVGNFKAVSTVASQGLTDTEKSNARTNIGAGTSSFSGSYTDLTNKPTIPSEVTESTVSGWGFTKNTGTYSKPSTGIPKTDLASAVQTSLGRADSALQSESDPVFSASAAAGIASTDITNWNNKVDKVSGKGLSTNDYTSAEKSKLAGIATGAQVNQNAFSKVLIAESGGSSSTTITAGSKESELKIYAGTNVNFARYPASSSTTATGFIINATDTTYNDATTTTHGLMSAADKTKLNGIAEGAEVNVNADWNATEGDALILNKPTIPEAVTESTVSGWGFTKNTGTYSKPSTGIPKTDLASAVQTSLGKADSALQSESDPVFSASAAAGITSANITSWNNKVDKVSGKGLSTNDFTTTLKNKLDGISALDNTEIDTICARILV